MILPIYTKVTKANTVSDLKGKLIYPEKLPLLRDKFLGEYRTELEKAKVRKNLGIPDNVNLRWENILGRLEESEGLSEYIKRFWGYTTDLNKDVVDVKTALDYLINFVYNFKSESEDINSLYQLADKLKEQLDSLDLLSVKNSDVESILQPLDDKITQINATIEVFNTLLEDLSENSGVYKSDLEDVLTPFTVGGIESGTSIETLKGKSINYILDTMLFPTTVRDLIYPTISYNEISHLVEVGSNTIKPVATFIKGDAGEAQDLTETISPEVGTVYNEGKYVYTAILQYNTGEYLLDNKGNLSTKRIEAGSVSTSFTITAVYPWYINDLKLSLVDKGITSIQIGLSGKPSIKLPKETSTINSFQVDGGLGFSDVNMEGWSKTVEDLNGIKYNVWTKNEAYTSELLHKLKFTLS